MSAQNIKSLINDNKRKANYIIGLLDQLKENSLETEERRFLISQCNAEINDFKEKNEIIENGIKHLKNGPEKNEYNEYLFLYKTNSEEFDQHFYEATTETERITVESRNRDIDHQIFELNY